MISRLLSRRKPFISASMGKYTAMLLRLHFDRPHAIAAAYIFQRQFYIYRSPRHDMLSLLADAATLQLASYRQKVRCHADLRDKRARAYRRRRAASRVIHELTRATAQLTHREARALLALSTTELRAAVGAASPSWYPCTAGSRRRKYR